MGNVIMGIIFKQQFTTTSWSGGVRIHVQQETQVYRVVLESGIATAGSSWSLQDTSKTWVSEEWVGRYIKIVAGSCYPQIRSIGNNDTDAILVTTQWDGWINNTSEYEFYDYYYPIGGSECTIPTIIDLRLGIKLATDIYSTIVVDNVVVCSEEIENGEQWVYLFWKPLPPGDYQWQLEVIGGDPVGTFKLMYDSDSTKFKAFEDSVELAGDFESEVLGVETLESYENVMSLGDTFDGGFVGNDGVDNVKVNDSSVYHNAIKTGSVATTAGGLKGRVATGSSVKVV